MSRNVIKMINNNTVIGIELRRTYAIQRQRPFRFIYEVQLILVLFGC